MKSRHRDQLAVGREVQRGQYRSYRVLGRMVRIKSFPRVFGSIIPGSLVDPLGNEGQFVGGEGFVLLRHLRTVGPFLQCDQIDEPTFLRFVGHHHGFPPFPAGNHPGNVGQDVIALGLCRLVAAVALGLENRANVFVITDLLGQPLGEFLPPSRYGTYQENNRPCNPANHSLTKKGN